MILSFSEMREEDRPPQEIWLDDEALIEHFDDVRAKHKDPNTEYVPLEQNELTRNIKRR